MDDGRKESMGKMSSSLLVMAKWNLPGPTPRKKPNPARSEPVLGPARSEPVLSPKAGTGLGFYRFSRPEPVSARPDFFWKN